MGKKRVTKGNKSNAHRSAFWTYCIRTELAAKGRANKAGVPFALTRYDIDALLVDQGWRCAVSGLVLEPPKSAVDYRRNPFSPSLDRIVPAKGYVLGNVRVVCTMVNLAMNEWGLENLMRVVDAIKETQALRSPLPKQEPLGEPFSTLLHENLWDTYTSTTDLGLT